MFLFLVTYVFSLLVLVWVEFCIFSCNFFIKLYTFFIYVYECMFSPYMYLHLLTYIYLHTSLLPVSVLSFKYFSRYFYWGSRLKCENYAFYWTPHLLLFFFGKLMITTTVKKSQHLRFIDGASLFWPILSLKDRV